MYLKSAIWIHSIQQLCIHKHLYARSIKEQCSSKNINSWLKPLSLSTIQHAKQGRSTQCSLFDTFVATHHVETLLKQFLMPFSFLNANFHISIVPPYYTREVIPLAKHWTTAWQTVKKSLHTKVKICMLAKQGIKHRHYNTQLAIYAIPCKSMQPVVLTQGFGISYLALIHK